jgi:CHAT domain-containing protein
MARRGRNIATTAITGAIVAILLSLSLAPAIADDVALPDAAARIEELLKAGKLTDAEAIAAASAKALAATPTSLVATETVRFASALSGLAYALAANRKVPDALVFIEQVASIRERVLGGDDPTLAEALNDEGILLTQLARYADAETVLARALSIREKQPGADAAVAQTLNNLAQAKKRLGRIAEAETLLRRTAALEENALGDSDPALGNTLADIADILAANGRAAEAEPLANRALAITEKALGPNNPEVARRLIKLANVTAAAGGFKDAEAFFRRALAIREKAFGAESQQTAGVLSNLANVILADGRAAEAEPILREALQLQIKLRGADHPAVGETIVRLANVLREEKRFDEADPLYAQGLAVLTKSFGEAHPEVAAALEDFGNLRFQQGRFDDALDLFRRAGEILKTRQRAGDPVRPDTGVLPRKQGAVFRSIAETGFEIADRDESRRAALGTEAYLAIQLFTHSRTGVSLEQVAARVGRSQPALRELVRQRESLGKQWQETEASLINALGKGASAGAPTAPSLAAAMSKLEGEIGGVDVAIARDFPDFSELINPQPLTVPETEALLGPDEALVTFAINDGDTLIWVITKERLVWVHSPFGEQALSKLVARLRAGVEKPGVDFDLAAAHELYAALLGPDKVQAQLAGKKQLIVVPSGPLTSLPFPVLLSGPPPAASDQDRYRKAAWLIRRYAVSVLPSVSSLRVLRHAAAADEAPLPFIGFGDPVFKLPGVSPPDNAATRAPAIVSDFFREQVPDQAVLARGLPELPETADELRQVSKTLGADSDTVITREKASETTVKTLSQAGSLENYRVVYFATHGLVAGEVEKLLNFRAEPGLALSLPAVANDFDHGLLTASEVADLKLNADWVILSACNTAAGDRPGAEALSGLARSFIYAGARSLLVSHWSVNSEAAVRLTTGTFAKLAAAKEMGKAEALRETMLAIVDDSPDRDDAHPIYWAPFSIIGYGGSHL